MEHTCPRLYVTVSQAASRKHPRDRDSGLVRPRARSCAPFRRPPRAPPSVENGAYMESHRTRPLETGFFPLGIVPPRAAHGAACTVGHSFPSLCNTPQHARTTVG